MSILFVICYSVNYVSLASQVSVIYWLVNIIIIKCLCLREACESALKEKHFLDMPQTEGFVDDATNSQMEQLEALERVFNKAAEDDTPAEVCTWLILLLYLH